VRGFIQRCLRESEVSDLHKRFDSVFFEKTRISLVTILYQEEKAAFNSLKGRLDLSDGSLYTHLEKLIAAGYVDKKKELAGALVQTVYFLTEDGRSLFRDYLIFIGEMLERFGDKEEH